MLRVMHRVSVLCLSGQAQNRKRGPNWLNPFGTVFACKLYIDGTCTTAIDALNKQANCKLLGTRHVIS